MVHVKDSEAPPSRSGSSLSLSSQSSHWTDCFTVDLTDTIAFAPEHELLADKTLVNDQASPCRDEDDTVDGTWMFDEAFDQALDEGLANIAKRKRSLVSIGDENEERPRKLLHTARGAVDSPVKTNIVRRTDTASTVVASTSTSQTAASTAESGTNKSASGVSTPGHDFIAPQPIFIAHISVLQECLERLPWGAMWEIVRYVTSGAKMESIDLRQLTGLGTNSLAVPELARSVEASLSAGSDSSDIREDPELAEFRAAFQRERYARSPWEELDREDDVLKKDPFGALGCNALNPNPRSTTLDDAEKSDPSWYGGKVHFTAKVSKPKGARDFRFSLERPTLGTSNRFMRRFGSRRFIRVRMSKDALMSKGDELAEYFRRPFIIAGAVFRAFFAKEQNVFLFRTNEKVLSSNGKLSLVESEGTREWSFMDFIKWHNDLEVNMGQDMPKWAARFALGLSNSVPGVRLDARNVRFEPDIICDAFTGEGKPPSEMQMTDGCGFANRALMQALFDKFPWQIPPTAVQCRIGGAKGLLLVRHDLPPEQEVEPMVWLRPSQTKIRYTNAPLDVCILPAGTDPAKLTIDVLRASRMRSPAKLSSETITNLAENGVPFDAFAKLFEISLHERVSVLTDWARNPELVPKPEWEDGPKTKVDEIYRAKMKLLWDALAKEGGVLSARLSRENAGRARAAGHVAEDYEEDFDDEDGLSQLDRALKEQSAAWWEDPISGCPSSLEETCMTMLDSGFRPDTCRVLWDKLLQVAKKAIKSFTAHYRFACPMSCSAFIVPDPCGVLGPNEIHVKSSERNMIDQQGRQTEIIQGDVLVTRHPCKVPSDVQKVRAVEHPRLSHYVDVIVVSTASHLYEGQSLNRHMASLTGGGDYDGDTMEVFWDPKIVSTFKTPDPRKYAVEPPEVQRCLSKATMSVSKFREEVPPGAPYQFQIMALQQYLLGSLQGRSLVGQYSTWWENSTYTNGYKHPNTIFLAYMFCAILDGSKTGVHVIEKELQKHRANKLWSLCPEWKPVAEERNRASEDNLTYARRDRSLPTFVMDKLSDLIKRKRNQEQGNLEAMFEPYNRILRDEDLIKPWNNACKRAAELLKVHGEGRMQGELDTIQKHVEEMYQVAREEMTKAKRESRRTATFTDLPIEVRQDVLRKISRRFYSEPQGLLCLAPKEVQRVKASYAYLYDHKPQADGGRKSTRFPFNVAMRELCEIKAAALGCPKTVADDFYHWMTINGGYLRKVKEEL